jgi:hypothetical protein
MHVVKSISPFSRWAGASQPIVFLNEYQQKAPVSSSPFLDQRAGLAWAI